MKSLFFKISFIYFFVYLLVPFFYDSLYVISGDYIQTNTWYSFLYISIFLITIYVVSIAKVIKVKKILLPKALFSIAITIYFLLSCYFYLNFDKSFRHAEEITVSGGSLMIIMLYIIKSFVYLGVLNLFFLRNLSRKELALIVASTVLSGTGSFLVIEVAALLLMYLNLEKINFGNTNFLFLATFLIPILLLSGFFFSYLFKTNLEVASGLFSNGLTFVFFEILDRQSVHYISITAAFNYEETMNIFTNQVDTFMFRLSSLLGVLGVDLNINAADLPLNRTNYLEISYTDRLIRAGASPGLLASSIYIFGKYLFFIPLAAFLYMLKFYVNNNMTVNGNFTAGLVSFILMRNFFESPLSFIIFIDPDAIFFMIMILFTFFGFKNGKISNNTL